MPFKLVREIPAEEFVKKSGRGPGEELVKPYLDLVGPIPIGAGAEIEIEGESQNATKRRITAAARTLGKAIKWKPAPEGHLMFQVVELSKPDESSTTKRKKKQTNPRPSDQSQSPAEAAPVEG